VRALPSHGKSNFSAKSKALSITEPPRRVSPVRARRSCRAEAGRGSLEHLRRQVRERARRPAARDAVTEGLRVGWRACSRPAAKASRCWAATSACGASAPRPRSGAEAPWRSKTVSTPARGLPQDRRVSLPRTPGVTVAAGEDRVPGRLRSRAHSSRAVVAARPASSASACAVCSQRGSAYPSNLFLCGLSGCAAAYAPPTIHSQQFRTRTTVRLGVPHGCQCPKVPQGAAGSATWPQTGRYVPKCLWTSQRWKCIPGAHARAAAARRRGECPRGNRLNGSTSAFSHYRSCASESDSTKIRLGNSRHFKL
jgi:hypothetical protein